MQPGFLHLDLRRGCSADALLSSLLALLENTEPLDHAFKALGFSQIKTVIVKDAINGIKGHVVQFYIDNRIIKPEQNIAPLVKPCGSLQKPQWNRSKSAKVVLADPAPSSMHPFLAACLNNEKIKLNDLKNIFISAPIKPELSAIAVKILEQLTTDRFTEQHLLGRDALWMLCHLIGLVAVLDALDPKFISATTIHVPVASVKNEDHLTPFHQTWLNEVLVTLPTYETNAAIHLDVVALSFVKTLAGHFGTRGESALLQLGIGFSPLIDHLHPYYCEALWCEARLPESMTELGGFNQPLISYRYEVSGLVPAFLDIGSLIASMSLHGAQASSAVLVHTERNANAYLFRFTVSDEQKREALEAFLVKGHAQAVSMNTIEYHELTKRLVNVPLGQGNKTSSARCYEYTYLDKIVRVEPHADDILAYATSSDYSIDVARSDLLMAWKKWRGKVVWESHDKTERER